MYCIRDLSGDVHRFIIDLDVCTSLAIVRLGWYLLFTPGSWRKKTPPPTFCCSRRVWKILFMPVIVKPHIALTLIIELDVHHLSKWKEYLSKDSLPKYVELVGIVKSKWRKFLRYHFGIEIVSTFGLHGGNDLAFIWHASSPWGADGRISCSPCQWPIFGCKFCHWPVSMRWYQTGNSLRRTTTLSESYGKKRKISCFWSCCLFLLGIFSFEPFGFLRSN